MLVSLTSRDLVLAGGHFEQIFQWIFGCPSLTHRHEPFLPSFRRYSKQLTGCPVTFDFRQRSQRSTGRGFFPVLTRWRFGQNQIVCRSLQTGHAEQRVSPIRLEEASMTSLALGAAEELFLSPLPLPVAAGAANKWTVVGASFLHSCPAHIRSSLVFLVLERYS